LLSKLSPSLLNHSNALLHLVISSIEVSYKPLRHFIRKALKEVSQTRLVRWNHISLLSAPSLSSNC
jgi:hypothetical protein